MKYASLFILVFLLSSIACAGPVLTSTPQTSAPTVGVTASPLPTGTSLPTVTSTPSAIPSGTPTPAPSDTPTPSPSPTPSGITQDSLSSLAQLSTFRPFNLSMLGNLMSGVGLSGTVPSQLLSAFLPIAYVTVAYSPDGKILALGGCTQFTGGEGYACSPPGKPILRLMDAGSGQIIRELEGNTAGVSGVAFSKDGKILVSATDAKDGTIRFWDTSTGSLLRSLKFNTKIGAPVLAVSPDGSKLAAAWYQNVRVWDFDSGTVLMDGASADGMPQFSKDGSLMVVYGSQDRSSIAVYDTSAWKLVLKFTIPAQTLSLALSPDGKTLVTGGENDNNIIHFWDISTGKELGHVEDNLEPMVLSFGPDGSVLFVGGLFKGAKFSIPLKVLSVYDPSTRQRIAELRAPSISARLLAMAPDGQKFAMVDVGGDVSIWGIASEQIDTARQVLLTYLDDLNQGKYADAAGLYYSDRIDANSPDYQFLKKNHPSLALDNVAAVLKVLCEDKRFPCAKFRDIVYQGSFAGNGLSFYIEYAAPDGSAMVSPIPCSGVPSTCEPVTAFLFNLIPASDGSYKLSSLPPAAEFP
jgi:hypothetical protein